LEDCARGVRVVDSSVIVSIFVQDPRLTEEVAITGRRLTWPL
jgi:hypothetical protein